MADFETFCREREAGWRDYLDAVERRIGAAREHVRRQDADGDRTRDHWYVGVYGTGHGLPERVTELDDTPETFKPKTALGPGVTYQ